MLTYKEKYKIFREMQHSFYVEISAKEILADEFEDKKDCNFPDNDIWESVIKDYILIRC